MEENEFSPPIQAILGLFRLNTLVELNKNFDMHLSVIRVILFLLKNEESLKFQDPASTSVWAPRSQVHWRWQNVERLNLFFKYLLLTFGPESIFYVDIFQIQRRRGSAPAAREQTPAQCSTELSSECQRCQLASSERLPGKALGCSHRGNFTQVAKFPS